MIDLYLSKNCHRNQLLLDFFQKYGIEVTPHSISEMTKDKLIEMMSYSSDCFEFLSPNLLDSLIVSEYQMEPNLWEVSHD